jgi:chemosensory pili system protein ChpA (sensor histidine kinase/response regulator)
MEELYRRVSDKQTMGSVVGELRVALGDLEKSLDVFFRNPKDKTVLSSVPGHLAQMRGVLSVLGLDQASLAVSRMRGSVEQMLETEIDEERARAAGTFDQLGNNLGALSFLIDMLNYQPVLAKKLFVYDDVKGELRPLMGRTEKVPVPEPVFEPVATVAFASLPMEVVAVVRDASSASDESLSLKLDALATHAELAGQSELAETAHQASLAASSHDAAATTQALGTLAAAIAPSSVISAREVEVEDFDEDDLRGIFLEEAREVSTNGLEAIRLLKTHPDDVSQLTILRRVFHTLKGSARMVGLNEFGEAGWAMEQLFNGWLADQKPASEEFLQLSSESLAGFSRWIDDIGANTDGGWSAATFRISAEAMRTENRRISLTLPGMVVSGLSPVPELQTQSSAPSELQVPEVEKTVELADSQASLETDLDFDFSLETDQPTIPASLGDVQSDSQSVEDILDITGIDFDSLSALSGVPEVTAPISAQAPATVTPLALTIPAVPDQAEMDPATAEMLEIEALQQQLDSFELHAHESDNDTSGKDEEIELVDLSADDFDAQFLMPTDVVAQSVPEEMSTSRSDNLSSQDEQIKVIGDLRIGIPLYNVYLNEADEWSRRLVAELSEWSMERKGPINDSTVSFAHSLAGSSATVGFQSLSEIARALENALLHSQAHYSSQTASHYAELFVAAAEDIRRLLHQFAVGFLKDADAVLIAKLNALDFTWAESDGGQINELVDLQLPEESIDVPAFELPRDKAQAMPSSALPTLADDSDTDLIPATVLSSAMAAATVAVAVVPPIASVFETPAALAMPLVDSVSADVVAATPLIAPIHAAIAAVHAIPVAQVTQQTENSDDEIDAVDAIDAELFPIFDEEAAELMPQLGSALRQWSARPDNLGARLEVLRTLHTLKGSARLAGALRLGEMAHRIESEIEFLGTDAAATQDFEPLLARYDAMQHTLDALRSGDATAAEQPFVAAKPAPPVIAEHEKLVSPGVSSQPDAVIDPASDETPASVDVKTAAGKTLIPAPQTMAMQPLRQAATASIRVRSQLLDRMVNQAGEVMITRSRLEVELSQLRGSLGDMTDNLNRLRQQLRDIELQAETQMQSRLAQAKELQAGFDPLEFDRFTRVQELTRMMAESVNDVATVQRTLQRTVEATEDDLIAQARQTRELQRDLLRTRMVEFEGISDRLYRVVRQASKDSGKQVKLDLLGGTIEMDRGMLDRMTPAFEHLLRNCVAHGIESPALRSAAGKDAAGLITVHLRQEGNDVSVEFSDDGAGLDLNRIREKAISSGLIAAGQVIDDQQAANLIFMPGFTTAAQITELSGRGIGMDVVRSEVNSVGGRIETASVPGKGTQFKLVLPLTTAVTQVVMIRSGSLSVGVPANVVETVRRVAAKELQQAYNAGTLEVVGEVVPFFWSGALFQSSSQTAEVQGKTSSVVIFRSAAQRVALHVDEVLGNQEVVVKNLGPQLSRLPGLAGMSVLASGAVVLIYNPVALASVYGPQARALSGDRAEPHMLEASAMDASDANKQTPIAPAVPQIPLVMVVDDSITVRRVTQRLLQREGYRVVLAADGLQALERLQEERPSVVLSDIEMPRMDGFDLARNIRADARLKDLPIVMITSRIAEKHREYAKELGVDHYLGKPYPEEELMTLVRHYCSAEALN